MRLPRRLSWLGLAVAAAFLILYARARITQNFRYQRGVVLATSIAAEKLSCEPTDVQERFLYRSWDAADGNVVFEFFDRRYVGSRELSEVPRPLGDFPFFMSVTLDPNFDFAVNVYAERF